jgi:CTP synthase
MSGRLLSKLIQDERDGKFLGKTVQVIPHLTNAIQEQVLLAGKGFDIHIVEIGGTVGDYESPAFIEAIRELGLKLGRDNCIYVHVVYLPYLNTSKEIKTKPAQNAVRDLRSVGIVPDILAARSESTPPDDVIDKLSLYGGVSKDAIVLLPDAQTIYQVPLTLEENGIGDVITARLGLPKVAPDIKEWRRMVDLALDTPSKTYKIGVVAKYLNNQDTYMSVFEALRAAAWAENISVELDWVNAEELNEVAGLKKYDGLVVPGGFGERGVEGKILSAQYALDSKIPYLGLCLGMQVGVIAAARRAGYEDANSTEFDPSSAHPVIATMDGQIGKEGTGGTMRLGDYPCVITSESLAAKSYGIHEIFERHRHRYEANNKYRDEYEAWGIKASGQSPDGTLVEIIEAIDHPFFLASQFHPEFKSRPNRPHPMFQGFIKSLK